MIKSADAHVSHGSNYQNSQPASCLRRIKLPSLSSLGSPWIVLLILHGASVAEAREWRVYSDRTGDAPSIQAGIDSSQAGDHIRVFPGTYYESIAFQGKSIRIFSHAGPQATVIDGGGEPGSVVRFTGGETEGAEIAGFTIRGGVANLGGGILVQNSEPSIRDNRIEDNVATGIAGIGWGGGVFLLGEDKSRVYRPVLEGNLIVNNEAAGQGGGIGAFGYVGPTIIGNTIRNNRALTGDGGGIWIITALGSPRIVDNELYRNTAGDHAGGLLVASSLGVDVCVKFNVLAANAAGGRPSAQDVGAAMWIVRGRGEVANNTFWANRDNSGRLGAAIYLDHSEGLVFARNIVSESTGGGISCVGGDVAIIDNLFWESSVSCPGGAAMGNIIGNPLFCNSSELDFTLARLSPALEHPAGPLGARPDIGCTLVAVSRESWGGLKLRFKQ